MMKILGVLLLCVWAQFANAASVGYAPNTTKLGIVDAPTPVQFPNPNDFGADPTGKVSSTWAFTKCIASAIKTGAKGIKITAGKYIILQSGIDDKTRPYGILLEGVNGFTIDSSPDATLAIDMQTIPTPINALRISNSTNVTVNNLNVRGQGISRTTRGNLYTGAGVLIDRSSNVEINGGNFKNTFYSAFAYYSSNVNLHDMTFINGNYGNYNLQPKSGILVWSTHDSKIIGNTIYGGLVDGDLSIFGKGSDNNTVSGNKLYGYAYGDTKKAVTILAQGITVDQGPSNNTISGNSVFGYYVGIDVKAGTHHNSIDSNTVESSVLGIAERRGESQSDYPSDFNTITNNTVIMGGNWTTENTPDHQQYIASYQSIGLYSETRWDLTWTGNTIRINGPVQQPDRFAAMAVNGQKASPVAPFIISNNIVNFDNEASASLAPIWSSVLFLKANLLGIGISDNTFHFAYDSSKNYSMIRFAECNPGVAMDGNSFPEWNSLSTLIYFWGPPAHIVNVTDCQANSTVKIGSFEQSDNTFDGSTPIGPDYITAKYLQ